MKIGVLGGSFDPVHRGHLAVAAVVKEKLNLSEILFVPIGQPWLRANNQILTAEHRVPMVRLAIADKPYFKLSTAEVARAGPSYTVETMAELRIQFGAETELFFILGWDNLARLPQWREPSRLITLCRLVTVPRPGYPLPNLNSLETAIPGLSQKLTILEQPRVNISATDIRKRVARGLPIRHLVPEPVDDYIKEHKLYLTQ